MRIGIIDDNDQFLKHVVALLKAQISGGEVFTWQSSEKMHQQLDVVRALDILIVDLNLPKPEGIRLIHDILEQVPDLNCIILTAQADELSILEGLSAGAVGYISKNEISDLGKAVKDVVDGKASISPTIALRIFHAMKRKAPAKAADYAELTQREQEVLAELATGTTAALVAEKLEMAFDTVRAHIKSIYKKFGVHSRIELIQKLRA